MSAELVTRTPDPVKLAGRGQPPARCPAACDTSAVVTVRLGAMSPLAARCAARCPAGCDTSPGVTVRLGAMSWGHGMGSRIGRFVEKGGRSGGDGRPNSTKRPIERAILLAAGDTVRCGWERQLELGRRPNTHAHSPSDKPSRAQSAMRSAGRLDPHARFPRLRSSRPRTLRAKPLLGRPFAFR